MPNDGGEGTKGQRGGTPLYMSPEQVTGNRLVDERTDIFSLGVVMYEMMAQREPFRGQDISATFDNIVRQAPKSPSEVAPHRFIPQPLEEICLKAMQKEPIDRFQSMQEMMEAINKFRSDSLLRGTT
jgi:serine/threonine protein kinase